MTWGSEMDLDSLRREMKAARVKEIKESGAVIRRYLEDLRFMCSEMRLELGKVEEAIKRLQNMADKLSK